MAEFIAKMRQTDIIFSQLILSIIHYRRYETELTKKDIVNCLYTLKERKEQHEKVLSQYIESMNTDEIDTREKLIKSYRSTIKKLEGMQ